MSRRIAVIGGGASGIFAALGAKRAGAFVTLFERNDRVGKKLLMTGNGRCNFTNRALLSGDAYKEYYPGGASLARSVISRFTAEDTLELFKASGIMVCEKEGYYYPYSDHASSVRDALELLIKREDINISTAMKVTGINILPGDKGFELTMCKEDGVMHREIFDRCIMACGSRACPDTGSDGFGYKLCKKLGIPVTKPYPALTRCCFENDPLSLAAGVRCDSHVTLVIDGKKALSDSGRLQILKDAISGIVVFQLSGRAIRAFEEGREVSFMLDLYPGAKADGFEELLRTRIDELGGLCVADLFTGIFVKPLAQAVLKKAGIGDTYALASDLGENEIKALDRAVRAYEIKMSGHGSFAQCQVCSGGIDTDAVDEDLMIRSVPGLYACGELLDVDGICGGYNLQFAISSGMTAGLSAGLSAGH